MSKRTPTAQSPHVAPHRGYRAGVHPAVDEVSFQVVVEETDLMVVAHEDLSRELATRTAELRGQVKTAIALVPAFGTSLVPIEVPDTSPPMIRAMAEAAKVCGVGPMAAVAGTIAEYAARSFMDRSPNILVENGGDLFLCSTRRRVAAILADPSGGASLGVALEPEVFPCSLCASSATIGHSLSLGRGDLVVARSANASLADAAATALCNLLKTPDDLARATDKAQEFGLDGIFAQCGGQITVWGAMELVAVE